MPGMKRKRTSTKSASTKKTYKKSKSGYSGKQYKAAKSSSRVSSWVHWSTTIVGGGPQGSNSNLGYLHQIPLNPANTFAGKLYQIQNTGTSPTSRTLLTDVSSYINNNSAPAVLGQYKPLYQRVKVSKVIVDVTPMRFGNTQTYITEQSAVIGHHYEIGSEPLGALPTTFDGGADAIVSLWPDYWPKPFSPYAKPYRLEFKPKAMQLSGQPAQTFFKDGFVETQGINSIDYGTVSYVIIIDGISTLIANETPIQWHVHVGFKMEWDIFSPTTLFTAKSLLSAPTTSSGMAIAVEGVDGDSSEDEEDEDEYEGVDPELIIRMKDILKKYKSA